MSVDRERPGMTPQAEAERLARLEREAAALRANLRRRKQQVRTRDEGVPAVAGTDECEVKK